VNKVDRCTILLLVYTSFCDSFAQDIWNSQSPDMLGFTLLASAALFFVVLLTMLGLCRVLGIEPAGRAAVVFCGSKKSLATGVPMAHLMFAGHPAIGLILLPIMLYHSLQLLVCAPIASYWAQRSEEA
jgi:sodium/bile acid cotransporter 7